MKKCSAVVLTVIALCLSSFALSQPAPDACALLTIAEVSAAVGRPVSGGAPSHTDDGGGQCVYLYGTMNQIGVELWKFPSAAIAQKRFSDELKNAQHNASYKTTVESGVGNRAFLTTGVVGTMKAVTWAAVQGSRFLHVIAFSEDTVPPDHLRGLMLKALPR